MPRLVLQTDSAARLDFGAGANAHLGMSAQVRIDRLPDYDGATEVTPSGETQILRTAGKSVESDIIVNPIPSNYGLVTWNGSVLTVS